MDVLKQLVEKMQTFLSSVETTIGELKNTKEKYESELAAIEVREAAVNARSLDLDIREVEIKSVEDLIKLKDEATARIEAASVKEKNNESWYASKVSEIESKERSIKDAQTKLNSDLADLKIKQGELTRDWQQLKEEEKNMRTKILAELGKKAI